MAGPAAPKDPTAKRSGFYILLEKEIFASEQPDGRAVHYIYLDMNRMITAAKISGHIEDPDMIENLKTTVGFRKMIHSIGVTIVAEDKNMEVKYRFAMYGSNNRRYEGTELIFTVPADGTEHVLCFDDITWADIDDEPGQMSFEFTQKGVSAQASVRLYLNDGFKAPEVEAELPVDYNSESYVKMIEKSLLSTGNTARVKRVLQKAERGEEVTVAFIGGSITQGAGATPLPTMCYAYQTYKDIQKIYGNGQNVKFVKAGIGGTPSELGMCRYDRDVLRDGTVTPDIVFIEFAVNDEGDETKGVCFESLCKKVLDSENKPAVVLVFSVFSDDWNLQDRLAPIGNRYNIPMVSVKDAVCSQFYLRRSEGNVITKNQYFYDMFHPTNAGHTIMKDCIMYLLKKCSMAMDCEDIDTSLVEPYLSCEFASVTSFARRDQPDNTIYCGDFCDTDTDIQYVEADDSPTPQPVYPDNWKYGGKKNGEAFRVKMTCKALLIMYKDSDKIDAGKADVKLDGKYLYTIDPREVGWTHTNARVVFSEKELFEHEVEIQMAAGEEDKNFTILGIAYCK